MATDPTTELPVVPPPASPADAGGGTLPSAAPPWVSPTGPTADPDRDPGSSSDLPWVTVSREATAAQASGPSTRRVVGLLVLGVVAALVLVGVLGTLAARQLAEREAVNDAATMADIMAEAIVQPAMTDALMQGDPDAVAAFDGTVRRSLVDEAIVRVKLWRPDGRVLYADEPALVGRTFELDDEQRKALAGPSTVAEVSTLGASENAFEVGDRLVEVYRPVWAPDGDTALFEIYLSYEPVAARTGQLWRGFAGVTASSLLLLVVIVTPLVLHLGRRLREAERQRTALLERAVDASEAERRRIAATLHDGPVQELAATSFTVAGASVTADAEGRSGLARDLDSAAAAVRGSIRSLRTLLVDIYPPSLEGAGIVAVLHDLAQGARRDAVTVELDLADEDDLALIAEAARVVYRVAQEVLRNAVAHARATSVVVSLHRGGPETVTLDVVDDGRGFDPAAVLTAPEAGHLGTRLLADVTSVPGATLRLATAPGAGTHWRLDLDGPLGVRR